QFFFFTATPTSEIYTLSLHDALPILLLNRGEYGGIQYFKPQTVDLFTSRQSLTSRRGLGFDRVDPDGKKEYPSRLANESVFGHRSEEHTSELQSRENLVCRLLLEKKK